MIHKIIEDVPVPANLRADFPNTSFPADLSRAALPDGYVWVTQTPLPTPGQFELVEHAPPVQGEDGVWKQSWRVRPWTQEERQSWRETLVCGPLQMRRALRQTGDFAAVQAAMASADEETREAWEIASEIRRMDPMVEAMRQGLGKTAEEVDQLFLLAQTL